MQVEGIGELVPWAEFWLLTYAGCGHDFYFPRTRWNYERDQVEAEMRRYYASCDTCAHARHTRAPDLAFGLR